MKKKSTVTISYQTRLDGGSPWITETVNVDHTKALAIKRECFAKRRVKLYREFKIIKH